MRALLASALLALAATAPAPAWAIDGDAQAFFAQGRKLRADGRCADAIVAFRRALELYPQGLGALRNIAECEEEIGQFASARNDWWSLRRAVLQSNEPKYEGWEVDAEQAYNRLAPKVARVTVELRGEGKERVEILIDGKPLDPRLIGVELERDVGPHLIELAYGGAAPLKQQIELTTGEREVVTLEIPKAPPPGPAPGPRAPGGPGGPGGPGAPDAGGAPSWAHPVSIAALSVGGAGVVGAVVSTIVRSGALSEVDEACPTYTGCPTSLEAAESRGRTAATLVNVFGAVAIVGVGVGVPLFLWSSTSKAPAARSSSAAPGLRVGAAPLAGGAAAQIGGSF